MSAADLKRLIQRATPRIEDVRSPDRTDFIRRHHGHLSLRETLEAVDALEFSAGSFEETMHEVLAAPGTQSSESEASPVETAVHSLFHALQGLKVMSPEMPVRSRSEAPVPPGSQGNEEAPVGWEDRVGEARAKGAESFKAKNFAGAVEHYSEAINGAAATFPELHALYSNRSAALLQMGEVEAALADARRTVALSPTWPKGHFREGCCLRQLGLYPGALLAFGKGRGLEPGNSDWEKEIERTERAQWESPAALIRQLLFWLLPEMLLAWKRGNDPDGVLQVQVNAELKEIGMPKWRLVREGRSVPGAKLRYAFLGRKEYLANLAANLQSPPAEGVAVVDPSGRQLNIAEIMSFLSGAAEGSLASVQLDVKANGGKMVAVVAQIPCDERVQRVLSPHKDPPPPKGSVDSVLKLQKQSGFPKSLPALLGFQSFPGDLNFPVIDLKRDMAGDSSAGS